jgi:hypothetical protein
MCLACTPRAAVVLLAAAGWLPLAEDRVCVVVVWRVNWQGSSRIVTRGHSRAGWDRPRTRQGASEGHEPSHNETGAARPEERQARLGTSEQDASRTRAGWGLLSCSFHAPFMPSVLANSSHYGHGGASGLAINASTVPSTWLPRRKRCTCIGFPACPGAACVYTWSSWDNVRATETCS